MQYILDEPIIIFSFFISMFYLLQYVGDCCKTVSRYCKRNKKKKQFVNHVAWSWSYGNMENVAKEISNSVLKVQQQSEFCCGDAKYL